MKSIIYLLCVILMTSCSIQNRKYTKGWDIQWKKRYHTNTTSSDQGNTIETSSSSQLNNQKTIEDTLELSEEKEALYPSISFVMDQNTGIPEQSIPTIDHSFQKTETKKLEKKTKKTSCIFKKHYTKTKLPAKKKNKRKKSGSMKVLATSGIVIILLIILIVIVVIPVFAFLKFFFELLLFL